MSEAGALFDPGFLGGGFNWWIGQVMDDTQWRDNILPGKFEDPNSIPGWGRRYKVRIMGLHDKEEKSITDIELPWANVMYPITAGGGQTGSWATPQVRQGNFVFGFFIDGPDQQVPIIMGVLGNNAQTQLGLKIGTTETNYTPTSGYAEGKKPYPGSSKPTAPDDDLVTKKPTDSKEAKELAPPAPGVKLDKFGLDPTKTLSKRQLQIATDAREAARNSGASPEEVENAAKQAVADDLNTRRRLQESPASPSKGSPTKENPDAPHQLSVADVKRESKIRECNVIMKPDPEEFIQSAITAIQTVINSLTEKLNSYLATISSYIDAASNAIESVQKLISAAACEIAKYMKIIFDKIMEFVMKQINRALANVVAALPTDMRALFADSKEIITQLILCLYGKLTSNICGQIEGALSDALNMPEAEAKARENIENGDADNIKRQPSVPTCYAEGLVSTLISSNKTLIEDANNNLLDNLGELLKDIQDQISGAGLEIPDLLGSLGDIASSIGAALSFFNFKLNIFGCELKPNVAVSDKYCMAKGGTAQPDSDSPSIEAIDEGVSNTDESIPPGEEVPYAVPTPGDDSSLDVDSIVAEERSLSDISPDQNTDPRSNTVIRDDIDVEIERAQAGDRSGLDDALDIQ